MNLPIKQVVLFNSGVGYFQREGEVEGNARVDLSFPASDINDLLKSLVLQDLGGGKVGDRQLRQPGPDREDAAQLRPRPDRQPDLRPDPQPGPRREDRGDAAADATPRSPARSPAPSSAWRRSTQPAGKDAAIDVDVLNLLCAEGLRRVPLTAGPAACASSTRSLDSEFQPALDVLAAAHDTQKKTVSLSFNGDGKRTVRVGYVVENPIWKTSYRLVLDKDGKPCLQGWAMVENTSDDDWNDVRMVLVSRPADLVPDGPVPAALHAAADRRAGAVRLAAAADLPGVAQRRPDRQPPAVSPTPGLGQVGQNFGHSATRPT